MRSSSHPPQSANGWLHSCFKLCCKQKIRDFLIHGWNDNDPVINEDKLGLKNSVLTWKLNKHQIPLFFFPSIFSNKIPLYNQNEISFLGCLNLWEPLQKLLLYSPNSEEPEPEPKNRHRGRAQCQNTGRRARNLESLRPGISITDKEEGGGGKGWRLHGERGWRTGRWTVSI